MVHGEGIAGRIGTHNNLPRIESLGLDGRVGMVQMTQQYLTSGGGIDGSAAPGGYQGYLGLLQDGRITLKVVKYTG